MPRQQRMTSRYEIVQPRDIDEFLQMASEENASPILRALAQSYGRCHITEVQFLTTAVTELLRENQQMRQELARIKIM